MDPTATSTLAQALPLERIGPLMRRATYASFGVAVVLIVIKTAAWMLTGSVSMLSTLIDSLMDAAASAITLVAVHHALMPADREHRFGHGKAEPLAGLAQAAFICGSGLFLLIEASKRLFNPQPIANTELGYWVMGASMILTVILVTGQKFVIRRTGSIAIGADAFHYQTDLLVNAAVLLSLFLSSEFGFLLADPVFALGIGAFILTGAIQISRAALHMLMDRELPEEERQRIREIALRHAGVRNVHDLKTRSSGPRTFIQMHLEMDRNMTLLRAHAVSDAVMWDIEKNFPNSEVIIHEDPEGVPERRQIFT